MINWKVGPAQVNFCNYNQPLLTAFFHLSYRNTHCSRFHFEAKASRAVPGRQREAGERARRKNYRLQVR